AGRRAARLGRQRGPRGGDAGDQPAARLPADGGASGRPRGAAQPRGAARMSGGGAATRVGELVGAKYRIVRLLAEGGMGVVYEAQHTVVRRRFAVKFLRRDLAERRDILTRFHHEAEAAGALESENVAAAVDFGIAEDGAPYIVMEYLVGESLTALLG